jgi:hypothetical protein
MSSGCGWRNGLQLWRIAANILNNQMLTNGKGWSPSFGGWVWDFTVKNKFLWINDPSDGIWIRDSDYGK